MSEMVPEGWTRNKLSSMVVLEYGKSPNAVKDDKGSYPIIGTSGQVGHATDFVCDQTSVVIGRKGTINKPMFIDAPFWAIDTTYFCKFSETTNPKWFFYKVCDEALEKHNEASGVPSLSRETLKSIQLDIPPLPEQKKIASILTSVDDVIEATQRQIDKLQDLKKATMNELLTKGIGHTEFKDSELGRIPKSWEIKPLSELVNPKRPITYGIVQAGKHIDGGIPYIRVSDMKFNSLHPQNMLRTSKEIASKFQRSRVQKGDIVYALRGKVGKVLLVPSVLEGANLTQGTAVLSKSDSVDTEFLMWCLSSELVGKQTSDLAKGSTFVEMTLGNLKNILIVLPTKSEQTRISKILSSVSNKIECQQNKLTQTQALKKSLMQDLLTGKVRVQVN